MSIIGTGSGGGGGGAANPVVSTTVLTTVQDDIDSFTTGQSKTILNIASGGAYLHGGSITGSVPLIKITVDGVDVIDTITAGIATGRGDDTGCDEVISIAIPAIKAETSLVIVLKNSSGLSRTYGWLFWYV